MPDVPEPSETTIDVTDRILRRLGTRIAEASLEAEVASVRAEGLEAELAEARQTIEILTRRVEALETEQEVAS